MWIVAKIKNNNKSVLKESFKSLFGSVPELYAPKILVEKKVKNKIYKKDKFILENYVLLKHDNFFDLKTLSSIKYLKGLEYILPFFKSSQSEIKNFISNCKKNENKFGYLSQSFFDLVLYKKYNFGRGPFINFVAELIEFQRNKIKVMVGNYTISINSKTKDCVLKTI